MRRCGQIPVFDIPEYLFSTEVRQRGRGDELGPLASPGVADDQMTSELELRDYLRVLNRRKWTVIVAAVLVLGSALAASFLQVPVYQGTAELLLQPRSTESLFNPNTGQRTDPARAIQTEIEVLK